MAAFTVNSFMIKPAIGFMEPDLARIMLFHLPCAITSTLFLIAASVAALKYLMSKEYQWEAWSLSMTEMASGLAIATMITGIIFSKVQWGAWWHWDPKQTSFLIVLLMIGAYSAIRMAFDDEVQRARIAAAFSVLSLLPNLFLIFIFPNLPTIAKNSMHPQNVVAQNKMSGDYRIAWLSLMLCLLVTTIWMVRLNYKALMLAHSRDNINGNLETDLNGPTAHRVDRTLPLS